MKKRLLDIFAIVSLLLMVALVALAIRGVWVVDRVSKSQWNLQDATLTSKWVGAGPDGLSLEIRTSDGHGAPGSAQFAALVQLTADDDRLRWRHWSEASGAEREWRLTDLFRCHYLHDTLLLARGSMGPPMTTTHMFELTIPYGLLIPLATVVPLLRLLRWRRQRRRRGSVDVSTAGTTCAPRPSGVRNAAWDQLELPSLFDV